MQDYKGIPVSYRSIRINGGFWEERRQVAREAMLPAVYDRFEETGRFRALDQGWREGEPDKPHIFWDSDVAKWIEGAAYFLQEKRDAALEAKVDELIARMERHQEADGYLNSYFSLLEPEAKFTRRNDHELYCAGHLIEAAVAWAQATGKKNLLSIAVKYADLIDRVFRKEHSAEFDTPGHEEIELALVRLYEYTGEERYKALAEYFIDARGRSRKDEINVLGGEKEKPEKDSRAGKDQRAENFVVAEEILEVERTAMRGPAPGAESTVAAEGTPRAEGDCIDGQNRNRENGGMEELKYMQSHLPVRRQRTAEGHAVRALYLYCGMADLALMNQDGELKAACHELYDNIVSRRMQITGGVGSTHRGESFTYDYDLPEYTTYNETCASIALAMFCRRMWLLEADGRYADCAEQAVYNTVLGGVSLQGDTFFYENPLAAAPDRNRFNSRRPEELQEHLPLLERVKVFQCSCCPPNLLRLFGSIGDYMYSVEGDTIYTQMYLSADADILLGEKKICLHQQTEYPYDGHVKLRTDAAGCYTIALRVPGWCRSFAVRQNGRTVYLQSADCVESGVRLSENGAYTYSDGVSGQKNSEEDILYTGKARETVSGVYRNGYLYIYREWAPGDILELQLDMMPELTEANTAVRNLCGRAAVVRGPVVYCAEGLDHPGTALKDIRLQKDGVFTVRREEIGGVGMPVLYTQAVARKEFPQLYRPYRRDSDASRPVRLKLIPYFAWANRGISEMNVWFLVQD